MKEIRTGILLLILILPITSPAACLLPTYKAEYITYIKGVRSGITTEHLQYKKQHYEFTSSSNMHYLLYRDHFYQSSIGTIEEGYIIPKYYYLRAKAQDKTRKYTVKKGFLDLLSYRLALRLDLISGKSVFSFPVSIGEKEMLFNYRVVQRENLINTHLGKIDTIVVNGGNKKEVNLTLWFAPKLDYLLVKSELRHKGKIVGTLKIKGYQAYQNGQCPHALEKESNRWGGKVLDSLSATEDSDDEES